MSSRSRWASDASFDSLLANEDFPDPEFPNTTIRCIVELIISNETIQDNTVFFGSMRTRYLLCERFNTLAYIRCLVGLIVLLSSQFDLRGDEEYDAKMKDLEARILAGLKTMKEKPPAAIYIVPKVQRGLRSDEVDHDDPFADLGESVACDKIGYFIGDDSSELCERLAGRKGKFNHWDMGCEFDVAVSGKLLDGELRMECTILEDSVMFRFRGPPEPGYHSGRHCDVMYGTEFRAWFKQRIVEVLPVE